jgi:hypothetical protein
MLPSVYYYTSATANKQENYTVMHDVCHNKSSVSK